MRRGGGRRGMRRKGGRRGMRREGAKRKREGRREEKGVCELHVGARTRGHSIRMKSYE